MIVGEKVVLRPVEDSDMETIKHWYEDPTVWTGLDFETPLSLQDVRDAEARSRADGHAFVIEAQGEPIGRIELNRFHSRDRRCAVEVMIGEPGARGLGHGRDALSTLIDYAFDRLDLKLVEADVLADNIDALRVFGRCGFVAEARLRDRSFRDGRYRDSIVLSVTREEFAAAKDMRRNASD
jgi:RimJ/RimL family protein N-acetyltransferase